MKRKLDNAAVSQCKRQKREKSNEIKSMFTKPEDHKLFLSQFESIQNSQLTVTFNIPNEIIKSIAEYSNGYFLNCSNKQCNEKVISLLKSEINNLKRLNQLYGPNKNKYFCDECQLNCQFVECCNEYQPDIGIICDESNGCGDPLCQNNKCKSNHSKCNTCNKMYCNKYLSGAWRTRCGGVYEFICISCGEEKKECDYCYRYCVNWCKSDYCSECAKKAYTIQCATCDTRASISHPNCINSTNEYICQSSWDTWTFKQCENFGCKIYICLECECEVLSKDKQGNRSDENDEWLFCSKHNEL